MSLYVTKAAKTSSSAPTYETSLPGSPTDGQEIYYAANATNGVIWHLRYRTAASKWEFLGGPPLFASVATSQATTSTSYTDLATAGPAITLPLAGDYDVTIGGRLKAGFSPPVYMSYSIGNTGATDDDSIGFYAAGSEEFASLVRTQRKTSLSAVELKAKYRVSNSSHGGTFVYRWIAVTPVRI